MMGYGTYSWSGHSYQSKSYHSECHSGNPLVFTTHDGIEVYAGGSSRSGGWWKMDELPEFAMGPDSEVRKGYSKLKVDTKGKNMEGWSCIKVIEEKTPPAVLEMDFPDYGVPRDCTVEFWVALAADLRERGIKTVHAMCMGGHGRTGIQLACLRWHLATEEERKAWPDAHTLITHIRDNYCQKAVEADKQQDYVAKMCGIPAGKELGFHKYQSTTKTTTSTGTVSKPTKTSLTPHNRSLLECDQCDLHLWEDDKVYDAEEEELCYDHKCNGHFMDVTELTVKRSLLQDVDMYQICLATLDVCSDVSGYEFGVLNEEIMEKMHGKEWPKLMDRLMSQNGKMTVRGKLLRALHQELKKPTADNVLVCYYDSITSPKVEDHITESYTGKSKRSLRTWKECGFCTTTISPDRLSVAYLVQNGKELAKTCCPECMVHSQLELRPALKTGKAGIVEYEGKEYTMVNGVSPQQILVAKSLRDDNKSHWDAEDDDEFDDIILNFDDKERTITQTGGRTLEDYADLSPAEKQEWAADILEEYGLEELPDDEIDRGLLELGLNSAELKKAQAEYLARKNDSIDVDTLMAIDNQSVEDYFDYDNVDPKYGGNNKEEEE